MADLRLIIACMKISQDLERIGDYARNGAKRAIVVSQQPMLGSLNGFERMAETGAGKPQGRDRRAGRDDAAKADEVWANDEPIDGIPATASSAGY